MVKRISPRRRLTALLDNMSSEGHEVLLDYAEFLAQRYPVEQEIQTDPVDVPRPDNESVVMAIKRLTRTYPMLDKTLLLHETSSFVTQHIVQGRRAEAVIDDMEVFFRRKYEVFIEKNSE